MFSSEDVVGLMGETEDMETDRLQDWETGMACGDCSEQKGVESFLTEGWDKWLGIESCIKSCWGIEGTGEDRHLR